MTPDTNKERENFEAWAVNEGFQIRRLHNPEAGRDYGIDSAQDAWEGWQARAAKAPAAPTGWYALAADGMATLCVDRDDAEKTAADSEKERPNCGPFRAVQLYTAPPAPTEQWVTENTTASGAADFPEFPAHPEPQIMRWSALEIVAIRKYGADMFRAGRLAACAPVAPTDENRALDLLATMFDAYENGVQCYEDPEEQTGYLGHALQLDDDTFHACADLLNRRRPVKSAHAAPTAPAPQPAGWTNADADAARLALELECLLLDTKDTAIVSKWWQSANEALELHRARLQEVRPSPAAPPAQEALLNPDMPTQELRLHMGELTTDEVLVARAAIRWANTYGITAAQKETQCAPTP